MLAQVPAVGGQPGDGFAPYVRGTIPFRPKFVILGADVGMDLWNETQAELSKLRAKK